MKIFTINPMHSGRIRWLAQAAITALPLGAHAQGFTPVTGLAGGAVSIIAADSNALSPTLAVGIQGLGVYTGSATPLASSGSIAWAAQDCEACANARNAAWDAQGRLWVASSGYGLWRGTPTASGATFTAVPVKESNIVQWIARAADGTMWAVLGNGVVQLNADGSATRKGSNATLLGIDKLAMPASASGTVYAASGGEVYSLASAGLWQALQAPADPAVMTQQGDVLYIGTSKGVYQRSGSAWTALGPTNTKVTGLEVSATGVVTIGTATGGVQVYSGGAWTAGPSSGSFSEKRVLTLAADASGAVYAGLRSGMTQVQAGGGTTGRMSVAALSAVRTAASSGLQVSDVREVVTVGNDSYALVAGQGVFSRVGKSARWTDVSDTLDDEVLTLTSSATAAYALTAAGTLYRLAAPTSAAGGWVKLGAFGGRVVSLAIGAGETVWAGLSGGSALMRDATTGKWINESKGLERAGEVRRLLVGSDSTVYAGTSRGGVFKWNATGKAWVALGAGGLPVVAVPGGQGQTPINALVRQAAMLYAATNHGVYSIAALAAADATWNRVGFSLPEPTVHSLTVDSKGALIAGTLNGAYQITPSAAGVSAAAWVDYGSTRGEVISAVSRVGNEVIIATRPSPGKIGRVIVGGG
jgi:ligand-binding sensor domain-containing protein